MFKQSNRFYFYMIPFLLIFLVYFYHQYKNKPESNNSCKFEGEHYKIVSDNKLTNNIACDNGAIVSVKIVVAE